MARMDCQTRFDIAERLNAERKKAGLRYQDLAMEAGIPLNTTSGYMSGFTRSSPERMQAMADVIGVSVDVLMGREEEVKA